jgi:hypothetical protein
MYFNLSWTHTLVPNSIVDNEVIVSFVSKCPATNCLFFLFNLPTGIWIRYDDLKSINIKIDYIKKNRLVGRFFWELSSDRKFELIGTTFNALRKDVLRSTTIQSVGTILHMSVIILFYNTSEQQIVYFFFDGDLCFSLCHYAQLIYFELGKR